MIFLSHKQVKWTDNIVSTQGHPEYDIAIMKELILPVLKDEGAMTADEVKECEVSLNGSDCENTVLFVKSFFMS